MSARVSVFSCVGMHVCECVHAHASVHTQVFLTSPTLLVWLVGLFWVLVLVVLCLVFLKTRSLSVTAEAGWLASKLQDLSPRLGITVHTTTPFHMSFVAWVLVFAREAGG